MKNFSLFCLILFSVCALGMSGLENSQANTVITPNFEGITVEVAIKILQTVGLQAQVQSASLAALVVRQEPRPGVSLPIGGAVLLATGAIANPPQPAAGVRTLQAAPSVAPRSVGQATNVASGNGNCGQGCYTRSLRVTVAPSQAAAPQENRGLTAPASIPNGQARVFYQSPQPAANPHLVANPTSRSYPAWYPKRFITQANPPTTTSQPQTISVRTMAQPQVLQQPPAISSRAVMVTSQTYPVWYPQVFSSQATVQAQSYSEIANSQVSVGVLGTAPTTAVPVPNLIRLYQNDAIAALTRAGLFIGNIIRVQSPQVGNGRVLRQSLPPRAIVPAGTLVTLWIAN